ncbi:MAG: hypothetical protein ACE5I4_09010 [Thermoplasmata archaeon]
MLVFTLLVLLMFTALASGLLTVAAVEPQIAANLLRRTQALGVAEAGAERAMAQLLATPGLLNDAPGACPAPDFSPLTVGTGTATVGYTCDGGFATVRIDSTGTTNIGSAERIVRAIVTSSFLSEWGVLAGEIEIEGDANIQGSKGRIHANGEVEVRGSGYVAQTATSSSSACDGCTDPSHVGVPGASGPNQPAQPIPPANPQDFVSQADFILRDDGMIKIVATDALVTQNTAPFEGWTISGGGTWTFSGGTTPADGTYYASQEITVTSSPGSPGNPWKATFIAGASSATGRVEIKGSPNITPDLQDLLILAGNVKLWKLTGNAELAGLIIGTASGGDVEVTGNVTLTGNIVSGGDVTISGNATIIYNSGTRTPLTGPLRVLSWTVIPES